LLGDPSGLRRRDDVAALRKLGGRCRLELVEQRHLPDLRLARVVSRPLPPRDVRGIAGVGGTAKLPRLRFSGWPAAQGGLRRRPGSDRLRRPFVWPFARRRRPSPPASSSQRGYRASCQRAWRSPSTNGSPPARRADFAPPSKRSRIAAEELPSQSPSWDRRL